MFDNFEETSMFTEGFLSGLFATEGILSVSSCLESLNPIAIDLDKYLNSNTITERLDNMGDAFKATSDLFENCETISKSDK